MAVTSARSFVNLKKGHFEYENDAPRINKYTLGDELPTRLSAMEISQKAKPGFSLRRITKDQRDQVIEFLQKYFFLDEPLNQAVQLLETPESRCQELEDYAAASLKDNVSVAAVDEQGNIVGIIINGIVRKENIQEDDKTDECKDPKFRKVLSVLSHLEKEARIWDALPESCTSVVEIRIASTHSEWRGRGLMRLLCEEAECIANEIGAGALRMDTTSAFSAAVAERLKFRKIYSVLYASLPDAPHPDPPHVEAKVYIKELKG